MATTVTITHNVPLRVFTGTASENVVHWVDHANQALTAAGLTKDDDDTKSRAAAALLSALAGAASSAVRVLPAADRAKPKAILDTLLDSFATTDDTTQAYTKLFEFSFAAMTVNEGLAVLHDLALRANAKMTDPELVAHVLRVLPDRLRGPLQEQGVGTTFVKVRTQLRTIESANPVTPTAPAPPRVNALEVDYESRLRALEAAIQSDGASSVATMRPIPRPKLTRPLGPGATILPAPVPSYAAAPTPGYAPHPSNPAFAPTYRPVPRGGRAPDPTRDRWTTDGQIICNHCKLVGHKAATCPSRVNRPF